MNLNKLFELQKELVNQLKEKDEQNKRYREAIEKAIAYLQNIKFASPDVESCSKVYSAVIGLNCALVAK